MKLIRWSVEHRLTLALIYAGLILLSAIALWRWVPLRLTPALESPTLLVVSEGMGMSALEVESTLTSPLERALAGTADIRSIRSMSMHGMSVVTLEFAYGYPMDQAEARVSAIVAATAPRRQSQGDQSEQHQDADPRVVRQDPLGLPVLRLAVRDPSRDPLELASFVEKSLAPQLKRVEGVRSLSLFGQASRQVEVQVDRQRSSSRGLSLEGIRDAIDVANSNQSAGVLRDVLTRNGQIRMLNQALRPADLAEILVPPREGPPVSLQEVASIGTSPGSDRPRYRYNGVESVEIRIVQKPGASSRLTVGGVRTVLEEFRRDNPGLVIEEAYDGSSFVAKVALNVWRELGLAIVLTGLVVFLFVGDWRDTLIALASIPAALALAVLCFVPLGLSLDSSTLIGLLLAIGRLVDDTIIDLDAVRRHRAMGKDARDAAVDGCSEVRRSVIAATVVICLAMLPLTFAGGLTQAMFEGIVWPYLLSLGASLLVAMTLTPCLVASVYRHAPQSPNGPAKSRERVLQSLESGYRRALVWALRSRTTLVCLCLSAGYLTYLLYPLIGSEMMPLADTGQIYAVLEARPGTSTAETARLTEQLESILRRQPEVEKISAEVGGVDFETHVTGYGTKGPSTASLLVTLNDESVRKRDIWEIIDAVYTEAILTVPNLRRLSLKEMGSDVMATSMAPVQLVIHGPDPTRLAWLAEQTQKFADQDRGLTQVGTSWSLDDGGWSVVPDRAALASVSLTPQDLARQSFAALEGIMTRTSLQDGTSIMVAYPADQRRTAADLGEVAIVGPRGEHPLRTLARIQRDVAPDMIEHDDLRRSNSALASYRKGGPGSMRLSMDWLMASRMQVGFPPGYGIEQRGDMVQMMESFHRLLGGLGLSLLLMYLALALIFGSAKLAAVIMAAIPLSLPGVFLALVVAGQTFSSVSLLALVVLIGMDVTASILLVDAVLLRRNQGHSVLRALLTGAPQRLRPVMMTVLVTLAVMAPLALNPASGMDAYAPLATVLLGGLCFSSGLTLLVVPALLSLTLKSTSSKDLPSR